MCFDRNIKGNRDGKFFEWDFCSMFTALKEESHFSKYEKIKAAYPLRFLSLTLVNTKSRLQCSNCLFIWTWTNPLKFIYSEKATKFCEIFTSLLTGTTLDKSKVKISQNFVAFSEYMNFNCWAQALLPAYSDSAHFWIWPSQLAKHNSKSAESA